MIVEERALDGGRGPQVQPGVQDRHRRDRRTSAPSASSSSSTASRSTARASSRAARACSLKSRKALGTLFFDTRGAQGHPHLRDRRPRDARVDERLRAPARDAARRLPGADQHAHRGHGPHPERRDRPRRAPGGAASSSPPTSQRSARSMEVARASASPRCSTIEREALARLAGALGRLFRCSSRSYFAMSSLARLHVLRDRAGCSRPGRPPGTAACRSGPTHSVQRRQSIT